MTPTLLFMVFILFIYLSFAASPLLDREAGGDREGGVTVAEGQG